MNLNMLEKMARQITKGGDMVLATSGIVNRDALTPVEHKSLSSLSWQIAANVRADGMYAVGYGTDSNRGWI
ncbi:MAG: hypothetical protein ABI670_01340 [Chloroflexota bacterium]